MPTLIEPFPIHSAASQGVALGVSDGTPPIDRILAAARTAPRSSAEQRMLLRLLASALGADTRERDRLRDDHELVAFLVGTVSSANADGVAVANALRALLHLVAHSQQPLAELLFSTVRVGG
jgi:hypothetical protein